MSTNEEITSVQQYLLNKDPRNKQVPKIICKDGFMLSVQASSMHYCKPPRDYTIWTHVEVAYPNIEEDVLEQYADEPDGFNMTIYPYVPIEIIQGLVDKHGGIDHERIEF